MSARLLAQKRGLNELEPQLTFVLPLAWRTALTGCAGRQKMLDYAELSREAL
jgi:hypothetical protein